MSDLSIVYVDCLVALVGNETLRTDVVSRMVLSLPHTYLIVGVLLIYGCTTLRDATGRAQFQPATPLCRKE